MSVFNENPGNFAVARWETRDHGPCTLKTYQRHLSRLVTGLSILRSKTISGEDVLLNARLYSRRSSSSLHQAVEPFVRLWVSLSLVVLGFAFLQLPSVDDHGSLGMPAAVTSHCFASFARSHLSFCYSSSVSRVHRVRLDSTSPMDSSACNPAEITSSSRFKRRGALSYFFPCLRIPLLE